MDLVEKLIEESKVSNKDSKQEDSRSRLKAVMNEEAVTRKIGVQHKLSAKLAKSKFTRPCSNCCCLSHCEKNPHNDEDDVQVEMSKLDVPDDRQVEFVGMLDRSWVVETTDYETEMLESVPFDQNKFMVTEYEEELLDSMPNFQDQFMSVLCSTHLDLNLREEEDVLENQTALADNIMVV